MTARIIVLNSVGSVGKSATARALQGITAEAFLHVAMDAFIDMLPDGMVGHADGLVFETLEDGDRPLVAVRSGPVLERAIRGMRGAVAAMAATGNNLIVDEVMFGPNKIRPYRTLLAPFNMRLFAPLVVLEVRERAREGGLTRWRWDAVNLLTVGCADTRLTAQHGLLWTTWEKALRFPYLGHRSAAVHRLHSTATTLRIDFYSGKGKISTGYGP